MQRVERIGIALAITVGEIAGVACATGATTPIQNIFDGTGGADVGDSMGEPDGGSPTTGVSGGDGGTTGAPGSGDDHTPPPSDETGAGETGTPCPVGSVDCPCTMGGGCDPGLDCTGNVCVMAQPVCGNGLVEDGEECDDGNGNGDNAACKTDCTAAYCGDGLTGPGEACDDGNGNDLDACSNSCSLASCGDGVTQAGEECDDANGDDTDSCLSTCLSASCGDSVVWAGNEQCDDGNAQNDDSCTNSCQDAVCGDGIVWNGVEDCDDDNTNPSDGCTDQCLCRWDFEAMGQISGWTLSGGWGLYTAAPLSSNPAVPFTTQGTVFGTDGNRVAPYPGAEAETSSITTTDFVLPDFLEFLSWNVDEGGLSYDTKRIEISTDGGATWTTVVDCAVGPESSQPFCTFNGGPRDEGDWDTVSIDISGMSGQTGRVRISYDTGDDCCSFEQGWFIDLASLVTCP